MKRTALVIIMALLFSAVAGAWFVSLSTANPQLLYFKPIYCNISIQPPQVETQDIETIHINFTIITNCKLDTNLCHYILDGREEEKVEDFQIIGEEIISDEMMPDINTTYAAYAKYTFLGQILLSNLSYGTHKLSVHAQNSSGDTIAYETITFTIPSEPELPPTISVVAPLASISIIGSVLLVYFKQHKG